MGDPRRIRRVLKTVLVGAAVGVTVALAWRLHRGGREAAAAEREVERLRLAVPRPGTVGVLTAVSIPVPLGGHSSDVSAPRSGTAARPDTAVSVAAAPLTPAEEAWLAAASQVAERQTRLWELRLALGGWLGAVALAGAWWVLRRSGPGR